ncbi:hypothetical protein [Dethiothermospora halolimnae]|uniref:hypothetical protein n=1 Tax=Dethiothermospora halolimnae TaxID=3114390 RepID=UPI003CCC44B8
MNIEELVKVITTEVLKKIDTLDLEKRLEKVLITDSKSNKEKYKKITSKWTNNIFLDEFNLEKDIDDIDYIIVPKLTNKDLVDIAQGRDNSNISHIVISGALYGKKIIILDEGIIYKKFKETSNEKIYSLFKEYESKLIEFGIEILTKKQIIKGLEKENSTKREKAIDSEKISLTKKLVIEKDIEEAFLKGHKKILIDKNSLVTPLAHDYIRINKINVIRK